jgi:hypothetical protein
MKSPSGAHEFFQSILTPRNHVDIILRPRQAILALGATPLHRSMQPQVVTTFPTPGNFEDFHIA